MSNNSSGARAFPIEQQASRPGRKRRATRGNLRRQANLDGVIVEETISFSMPSSTNKNNETVQNGNGQNILSINEKEVGEGCYVSSTINNRRYYGVLIDQSTLLKASELYFMEEAASLDINRRMMFLHDKHNKQIESEKKLPHSSQTTNDQFHDVANSVKNNPLDLLEAPTKKQKMMSEIPTSSMIIDAPRSPDMKTQPNLLNIAKPGKNVSTGESAERMPKFPKDKQVQKFEYIRPAVRDKNSPGYRKLLATYANVAAASEECPKKANQIYSACESGGDFVGDYYFQYQIDESMLRARHASTSGEKMVGFRTSLSLHTFLRNSLLPEWYPLSNLKVDQSKILNMLQMKKNNKGGVEWDKQKAPSESVPRNTPTAVPLRQPLFVTKPRNTYRIGILGGGIAGLACAAELLRLARDEEHLEIEVILIEGRSRVGGRLLTDYETFKSPDGKEFPVDLGASWIHGIEKNPLTDLAKDAKVDFVRASEEVKMLTSNMREVDKDCDKRMGKLFDELLDQAADNCWNKDEYIYKKGRFQSAVRWYASNLANEKSSEEAMPTEKDVPKSRYTSDISVDRAIGLALKQREDRIHLSNQDHNLLLWNTKNTEYALGANITDLSMKYWDVDEKFAFKGDHVLLKQGYSKIVDHLLSKCKEFTHFKHILNFPIGRIEYARNSSSLPYPNRKFRQKRCVNISDVCTVHSRDGVFSHNFDFVVCALPLGVLKDSVDSTQTLQSAKNGPGQSSLSSKVIFHPPLPASKKDAIENVGFGLLNKVYLQFPYAFWRKPGNREFHRGYPFLGSEQELFGNASGFNPHHYMFFDVGRSLGGREYSNSPHILLTLISGREAVSSECMSEKELVEDVMKTLRHLFSSVDVPEPINVRRTKWGSDEFSRGSYTYLPPGSSDQDYHTLQSPVNASGDSVNAAINGESEVMRLFWAGEHTTSLHPSMAHGALLSGIRAAREVVDATEFKVNNEDFIKRDHVIPVSLFRWKRPSEPVRCSLCHFPGSRRREGTLCAFQRGKQQVLVHTNCASFCPEVEVKLGLWKYVIKAVIRGKQISCSLCRRNGATIGCVHAQCSRSFHFGCCEDTGWSFARYGKAFLCDLHRSSIVGDHDNPISIPYFRSKNPHATVNCYFCGTVGDTNSQGKLLGFQRGSNQQILVHTNCLRYSSVVDTWDPSTHTFQNVFEAVYRAQKCIVCRKVGATIACSDDECDMHYHYHCAEQTGWNFQTEDIDFTCPLHRPSSHVAKMGALILPAPSVPIKNKEPPERSGFIQHDLFCSGSLSSKGTDAVLLPVENRKINNDDEKQIASSQVENNEKKDTKDSISNEETEEDDDDDDDDDDDYESGNEYEDDEDNEEENLMQPFTIDPHTADEEIGRTYVHSVNIKANRFSVENPWKIDLVIDRSTSSKTTTLRVDNPEKEEAPYGMKKGDIITSLNGMKVGSTSLSIITQVLSLMKRSVELQLLVLRRAEV